MRNINTTVTYLKTIKSLQDTQKPPTSDIHV